MTQSFACTSFNILHIDRILLIRIPSLPYKKQGNPRKSYIVIYENIKVIESTISGKKVSRAGGGWGVWSLCIKIGYSKPTRAENPKGTST